MGFAAAFHESISESGEVERFDFPFAMDSSDEWTFVPPPSEGSTTGDGMDDASTESDNWSYSGSLMPAASSEPEVTEDSGSVKLVLQIVHHHHYHIYCNCPHPALTSGKVKSDGAETAATATGAAAAGEEDVEHQKKTKRPAPTDASPRPALKRLRRLDGNDVWSSYVCGSDSRVV